MKWRDAQNLGISAQTIQRVKAGIAAKIPYETVEKVLNSFDA